MWCQNLLDKSFTNALRGLAILFIMAAHLGAGSFHNRFFTPLGSIGVAMFLFLSGYGLTESYKRNGLTGFWLKKVMRVALPYLLWILIFHFVVRLSPLTPESTPLVPRYWFIEYLIIWYLVFYLAIRLPRRRSLATMLFVAVIMFFVFDNIKSEQSLSFVAGVATSFYRDEIIKINRKKIVGFCVMAFLIGICALALKQTSALRLTGDGSLAMKVVQLFIKFPLGITVIAGWQLFLNGKHPRILVAIGLISYELYLTHMNFFSAACTLPLVVVFLLQSFVLAYLINFCNKKINGLILARQKSNSSITGK